MSRKRQAKKEQQRAEALAGQLADLYRRGADDAFLERVHASGRELPEAMSAIGAERYGEVADRALRQALAEGDLERLGRILGWLRRDAACRPLARLAAAVDHLAHGRHEAAQTGLEALTAAVSGESRAPFPRALLDDLLPLGAPEPPADASPESEPARAFYREMARLEAGGSLPGLREIADLGRALRALRAAPGADLAVRKILEAADERLRLLAALQEVADGLRAAAPGRLFLEPTRGLWRPLHEVFRAGAPVALLRPLQQALRLRWRGLLEVVASSPDAAVLTEARGAAPALFAMDLEEQSAAGPREGQKVHQLLAAEDFRGLAHLLEATSRSERAPERVVVLWTVELWARKRAARREHRDSDGQSTREVRAAQARLRRMAEEIAVRIPEGQRSEVARFLGAELLPLLHVLYFSRDFLDVAGALLRHREDDPALLAIAALSAVCAEDARARELLARRIVARGPVHAEERKTVLEALAELEAETAPHIARGALILRPLLGDEAWPAALVAATDWIIEDIVTCLFGGWSPASLVPLRQEVESCRSLLPEAGELAALAAGLDALGARTDTAARVRQILLRDPGLDAALVVLRLLDTAAGPWGPRGVRDLADEVRAVVVARLDSGWRRWRRFLSMLVVGSSPAEVRKLENRLRRLLKDKHLTPEDREALREVQAEVAELKREQRDLLAEILAGRLGALPELDFPFDFSEPPPQDTGRQRRKRSGGMAAEEQLDFDFF